MTIFNIPIEPIPMRYSCDWQEWFSLYWRGTGKDVIHVFGLELTRGIEQGKFLDCVGTNYHKSSQLMEIMRYIKQGIMKDGDVLFFHDLWFPGIEQIAYTCNALNLYVKITGCLHAGAYDPNDFLYQSGMSRWAVHFEHMLLEIADKIFVATNFHKRLIVKGRTVNPKKIIITGFPIKFDKMSLTGEKEKLVVFPHRPDPEKNPLVFKHLSDHFKDSHPDWKFINTRHCKTKDEYYTTLGKCKIAVSTSDQETWGIAMQECVASGCIPLVPDKLSYQEMFLSDYRYSTTFILIDMLEHYMYILDSEDSDWEVMGEMLHNQFVQFRDAGQKALVNITKELLND